MKIFTEQSLADFNFWGGARANAEELSTNQLEEVDAILEDLYPNGVDETTVNDLFWFEFDQIKEWLGIDDEDEEEEEDDEDEE